MQFFCSTSNSSRQRLLEALDNADIDFCNLVFDEVQKSLEFQQVSGRRLHLAPSLSLCVEICSWPRCARNFCRRRLRFSRGVGNVVSAAAQSVRTSPPGAPLPLLTINQGPIVEPSPVLAEKPARQTPAKPPNKSVATSRQRPAKAGPVAAPRETSPWPAAYVLIRLVP
jgi:hypothetical protein